MNIGYYVQAACFHPGEVSRLCSKTHRNHVRLAWNRTFIEISVDISAILVGFEEDFQGLGPHLALLNFHGLRPSKGTPLECSLCFSSVLLVCTITSFPAGCA